MSLPSLNDLVVFQTIARVKSFRQAALELGVSASALSHTMRHLEEQLGIRLLQRTTRSVALTQAGAILLEQLNPAFEQIAQALDHLNEFRSTPQGSLRLNVPANVAQVFLAPQLSGFLKQYPEIKLEIVCEDGLVDIVAAGFDAGIRFEESLQQDMIALALVQKLEFVVVAAPDYLAQRGIPQSPQALVQHECLRWRFSNGESYAWEFVEDGQISEVSVRGGFSSNDSIMLLEAARQGLGLGLAYLFKAQVEQDLQEGRLVSVLAEYCPKNFNLFLYYPSRKQQSTCLKAFIDYWRNLNL